MKHDDEDDAEMEDEEDKDDRQPSALTRSMGCEIKLTRDQ